MHVHGRIRIRTGVNISMPAHGHDEHSVNDMKTRATPLGHAHCIDARMLYRGSFLFPRGAVPAGRTAIHPARTTSLASTAYFNATPD